MSTTVLDIMDGLRHGGIRQISMASEHCERALERLAESRNTTRGARADIEELVTFLLVRRALAQVSATTLENVSEIRETRSW